MQTVTREFGTLAYVYQNAAPTTEAACAHTADIVRTVMRGVLQADAAGRLM